MSLAYLRDAIIKRLEEQADGRGQAAIDFRFQAEMTADQYAMMQVDRLAEARGITLAARIVKAEYKRMTETETQPEATPAPEKKVEDVY